MSVAMRRMEFGFRLAFSAVGERAMGSTQSILTQSEPDNVSSVGPLPTNLAACKKARDAHSPSPDEWASTELLNIY
jgi:hypothetical protein